jgi:hypothetical protein
MKRFGALGWLIETKLLSKWLARSSTNFSSAAADAGIVIFVPALVVTTVSPSSTVTRTM